MTTKKIYLSHVLDTNTPSYGNRAPFILDKKKSMCCGDKLNDSYIHMAAHLGTHIDLPYHFYKNGLTLKDYPIDFWYFNHPIFLEVQPKSLLIKNELIEVVEKLEGNRKEKCDLLIVKTGIGAKRGEPEFWQENPGFSGELYDFFINHLPNLRVFGFDSLSLTSFKYREEGRLAHKAFLNPIKPILILEDMRLNDLCVSQQLISVLVSPLQILNCDGLPCTVFGEV